MHQALKYAVALCIVLSDCYGMTSQAKSPRIVVSSIVPPEGLILGELANSLTTNSAFLFWLPVDNVYRYIVRIYRVNSTGNVLEKEVSNVNVSVANITNLESGVRYKATVAATFLNAGNLTIESDESKPLSFRTKASCKGGQKWSACNARCVSKCDDPDPDPVCSRVCVPGCACPLNAHIWHNNQCIVSTSCPAQTGSPQTVTGLHVVKTQNRGTDVILSWDFLKGQFIYQVTVRLARDRSKIVQSFEVSLPIARVSGLKPGKLYAFSVQAFVKQPPTQRKSALLPPLNYELKNITNTSFTVIWRGIFDAARYSFALFDDSRYNILYENGNIAGNSMDIVNLSPGTTYFFSLATAGFGESIGSYSPLKKIVTKGMKNKHFNSHQAVIETRVKQPVAQVNSNITASSPDTMCVQEYKSVKSFYKSFPNFPKSNGGPKYPNCDKNGLFVTTVCKRKDPNSCHCVDPLNKRKIPGSNFGGSNAQYPLDCNNFGKLSVVSLDLRVVDKKSDRIEIKWNPNPGAISYVVMINNTARRNDEKTVTVSVGKDTYTIEDLEIAQTYLIGLYFVNRRGATNPMDLIEVTTAFVDPPTNLKVFSRTADALTVVWKMDYITESYEVTLMYADSKKPVATVDVFDNRVTFTKLKTSTKYIVQVRAEGHEYREDSYEAILHMSDPASIEVLIQCSLPPLDIIFVFDIARSARFSGLEASKNLAANVLLSLPPIDPTTSNGTRVAALRYYRTTSTIFNYDRFKRTANAYGALKYTKYNGGRTTNTGHMLGYLYRRFFVRPQSNSYKKRPNALSVTIVFSFGYGTSSISQSSRQLKRVTNVIAIGVSRLSSLSQLRRIASSNDYAIMAKNYKSLSSASDVVMNKLCNLAQHKK